MKTLTHFSLLFASLRFHFGYGPGSCWTWNVQLIKCGTTRMYDNVNGRIFSLGNFFSVRILTSTVREGLPNLTGKVGKFRYTKEYHSCLRMVAPLVKHGFIDKYSPGTLPRLLWYHYPFILEWLYLTSSISIHSYASGNRSHTERFNPFSVVDKLHISRRYRILLTIRVLCFGYF